ncbi:DUF2993 domain-containing protein [Kineococcus gynurae]|uniref:DUF2993 domain-containing protein n=1 Tax=Kineococcus gynurae TaxID=452979 RepID=A0ABV5LXD3_9ACTN
MRRIVRLLVTLLALAVVVVAADIGARTVVLDRVADELQQAYALPERPAITAAGGSFLLQAVRGRYDDVTVRAASWPGEVELRDVEVTFPQVEAPAGIVLGRQETVRLAEGHAAAVVGYDELSRLASQAGVAVTVTPEGRDLKASSGFSVLGQEIGLALTAEPEIVPGTDRASVRLTPLSATVAGQQVSLDRVRQFASTAGIDVLAPVDVPLTDVPPEVDPRTLEVTPGGVTVRAVVEATEVPAGG